MAQIPLWLQKYKDRGFRLLFYEQKDTEGKPVKGPTGKAAVKWTEQTHNIEDWKEGLNVGTFLGHEISPGRFLADIDFDWTEGIHLSRHLLPSTGFGFGRKSRLVSHAFYTTPSPILSKVFEDVIGGCFVELRGVTPKGVVHQTMIPPSVHPSGEILTQRTDEELSHVEDLEKWVTYYAIACILYAHLGSKGMGHDVRLAIAGFLLKCGIAEEDVVKIGKAIAEGTGNSKEDVALTTKTTAAKIHAGERVQEAAVVAKAIGDHGRKVIARIKEWLGSAEFFTNDKGFIVPDNRGNILTALEKLDVTLYHDQFAAQSFVNYNGYKGPLKDEITNRTWLQIQDTFHFKPSHEFFNIVVSDYAFANKFHPVRDYLDSLHWDGVPRVNDWLSVYGGAAKNSYTEAVGSLVLIAAVRRVRQPGCKFDEMLILESDQGTLKSSALKVLCPHEDWFSDDLPLNVDAKQIIERTAGKWIIEASELKGMSGRDVDHLKSMISRSRDGPVRLAYERNPTQIDRQFIIIGTTNSHIYLKDDTGGRRFWPVRVERFDTVELRKYRDQIWAEAAHREAKGESIRLDPKLYDLAGIQQERRRQVDPWEALLEENFGLGDQGIRLKPNQIWAILGISPDRRDARGQHRISGIMQRLGYVYKNARDAEGNQAKQWVRDHTTKPQEDLYGSAPPGEGEDDQKV